MCVRERFHTWLRRIAGTACAIALATPLTASAALPDLIPEISDASVRVSNVAAGDVAEGCAGGSSNRRLVRYTVAARNIGAADLVIGNPGCPNCAFFPGAACTNPLYVCSTAHGHAHFASFIQADLRDLQGNLIAGGRKSSFCLGDVDCAVPKYDCSFQGISAGCADIYSANTSCQYIDISAVAIPEGTYVLHTTIDPDHVIAEANDNNNSTEALVFIGAPPTCPLYESSDTPKAIQDLGSATSTLDVSAEGTITNLQVVDLIGNHTRVGDLEFRLTSPSNTSVTFLNRICGSSANFHLSLHDEAASPRVCPPTDGQYHPPSSLLAAFDGQVAKGRWTLTVFDRASGNVGSLQGWGLAICTESTCPLFPASTVPRVVPDGGSVASSVTVPLSGDVVDVNLVRITASHTAVGDLELHLISPSGSDVIVLDNACNATANLDLSLDDDAASTLQCATINSGQTFRPSNLLAAFHGEAAAGVWTLVAIDNRRLSTGSLNAWTLQVCTDAACGTYAATSLPMTIPDLGSMQASVSVPVDAAVSDINVVTLSGSHPRFDDLQFQLTSPTGRNAVIATTACASSGSFAFGLDDSANTELPCPPGDGLFHRPSNSLDVFNNEPAIGLWSLSAFDNRSQNWGDLNSFALQICTDRSTSAPSPTRTPSAGPSPTPSATRYAALDAQNTAARPGGMACISTRLSDPGLGVGQTRDEFDFDAQTLSLIDCTISPVLGPGSAYDRQLTQASTPGLTTADVVSSGNPLPLPSGIVHTCRYNVTASASGVATLLNTAKASTLAGAALPTTGSDAQVTITSCSGDCNGNGMVTIGEVTNCVNLFLGTPMCDDLSGTHCPVADANNNGQVSIGEVVQCVSRFLRGCS